MRKVAIEGVESNALGSGADRRELSDRLGTTGVAINHYRIPPGGGFPGGLHAHADQEEVFVVVEGAATFETLATRDGEGCSGGELTVSAGEAIRFTPGEFQSGRNGGDGDLVAFAMGAPRDSEDVRIPLPCPECDQRGGGELRLDTSGEELALVCPDCAGEFVPEPCPSCGHDDLRAALGGGAQPVALCQNCDAEFEKPPLSPR